MFITGTFLGRCRDNARIVTEAAVNLERVPQSRAARRYVCIYLFGCWFSQFSLSRITSTITGRRQAILHFKTHGLRRSVCIVLLSGVWPKWIVCQMFGSSYAAHYFTRSVRNVHADRAAR